jgi:hypothetical protein
MMDQGLFISSESGHPAQDVMYFTSAEWKNKGKRGAEDGAPFRFACRRPKNTKPLPITTYYQIVICRHEKIFSL